MISPKTKYDCCGCEACVQACPSGCISFPEDAEGFAYPKVNAEACIGCGLCEKVCPVLNSRESSAPLSVSAARNKSEDELMKSSSGGVFAALSRKVLRDGGVVFGAAFSPDFYSLAHRKIESEEELAALMGSKYLQSRTGKCFSEAKACLESGRQVLYCGTLCQIKALKLFLGKDYDNLLSVDIICHGVPSPAVWRSYLRKAAKGGKVESVSFRDKRTGWADYSFTMKTSGSVEFSQPSLENPYMWLFLNNYSLRPSCFACPAKKGESHSDLTLGDYWGIENKHPEFYDERGVGLIMVHSEKGRSSIESLNLDLLETSFEEAVYENTAYLHSGKEPRDRAAFFKSFSEGRPVDKLYVFYRRKKALGGIPAFFKKKLRAIKKRLP